MITQEELHELFDYREDGNLIYKVRRGSKIIGDIAGSLQNGRITVGVNKNNYGLHTLIYIFHNGDIRSNTHLYHKNKNRLDNRIENIDISYKGNIITQLLLQNIFIYNNGKLFWNYNSIGVNIGDRAGSIATNGYRVINFANKHHKEHRLIYIYHYGDIPDGLEIDHINMIRDDNRIENLRLVTPQENHFNSSVKGYSWHEREQKWRARIIINGQHIYLGYFDLEEDSRQVYLDAKKIYHTIPNRITN